MTQISPKNVALASIASLIVGTVASATVSAVIPSALLLWGVAGLLITIGCFGLLFAYYYTAVNLWDAGNRAGAVAFLAFPLVAYQMITHSQTAPLAELAGMVAGSLALTAVVILVGLWVKNRIKQHLLKIGPGSPPTPSPGYPTMALCAAFMVLLLIVVPLSAEPAEYSHLAADSPRDWYDQHGIQFSYPRGLQMVDGAGDVPNTYDEGMVLVQDPGGHEATTVVWTLIDSISLPPSEILAAGIDEMNQTPDVWNLVRGAETTRQVEQTGHTITYLPFSYDIVAGWTTPEDPLLVHRWGYLGSWHCSSSGRTIMVVLETRGGTDVADGMLEAFLATAKCH